MVTARRQVLNRGAQRSLRLGRSRAGRPRDVAGERGNVDSYAGTHGILPTHVLRRTFAFIYRRLREVDCL